MKTYCILMAGGVGNRVGAGIPKQFVEVQGKPVIAYTMQRLQQCSDIDYIVLSCVDGFQEKLRKIADDNGITKVLKIVTGGKDYEHSIINGVEGLKGIAAADDVVMIHWAASPFVSDEILKDNIRVCREKGNAMSTCSAFVLYGTNNGDHADGILDRDTFKCLSAPQSFLYKNIVEFYRQVEEKHLFDTVEAHTTSLMAALGWPIYFSKGDQTNIKITTKEDLQLFKGYVLAEQDDRQHLKKDESDNNTRKTDMIQRNAIILAAGKSSRFAPFTYERPKGLFRVKGEILIERQIEQLREAGVTEIYVVVGYMKEKFFYLEQKYPGVQLIVNNRFGVKGNLYSVYVAKDHLHNTYVCCADHYFVHNPFLGDNPENISYRACAYKHGRFGEFSARSSDAGVITEVDLGGTDRLSMVGQAYFNESFSARFRSFMETEINDFRVSSLFWEEYFGRHIQELTLFVRHFKDDDILEFNTIDDLRQFDSDFLYNVDSEIISNICNTLHCHPNGITDINVINAGLTNVSFRFTVDGIQYVYRHPGGTAGNLINREAEMFSQMKARELEVDKSVITMELTGWKISYCVQDLVECDFRKHPEQLKKGMEYLRRMHAVEVTEPVKTFDDFEEALKLMRIASSTKGNLLAEFSAEIEQARRLSLYLKADAERMGIRPAICHNDTYEPNFLATKDGGLYLIDWEYAGMNDPANDLACFFCRYDYADEEIEQFMREYFQRDLTPDEHRHWHSYIALCAFYWQGWGLYKGSVGDDDGFFFLPAYRNFKRFIQQSLDSFEKDKEFMDIVNKNKLGGVNYRL